MTTKHVVATLAAVLILCVAINAQSPVDQLQKGIYAQETAGDLDTAIQIFRQLANPASANKTVAAQAQYRLVLCMLQRGDRPGAAKEVDALARNFPDQAELIANARKLLPGGMGNLPAPWPESEVSQLNIKRDGVATGEYLYYTIDPEDARRLRSPNPNEQLLQWELVTKNSKRSALAVVDQNSGQLLRGPELQSDDYTGDPLVESLSGPAIDIQQSVFAMRRLPLAVGYKTTLKSLPLVLSRLAPADLELTVTSIEQVEVTAGKFRCYKVSFPSISQTFWFGVEGSRPLVKLQSGATEAELVKIWGPGNFIETELAFLSEAGWKFPSPERGDRWGTNWTTLLSHAPLNQSTRLGSSPQDIGISASAKKFYTAASEIPQALLKDGGSCRSDTIELRTIGGQRALSCFGVYKGENGATGLGNYQVWIRSENATIRLGLQFCTGGDIAVCRWQVDQALATAKHIP